MREKENVFSTAVATPVFVYVCGGVRIFSALSSELAAKMQMANGLGEASAAMVVAGMCDLTVKR